MLASRSMDIVITRVMSAWNARAIRSNINLKYSVMSLGAPTGASGDIEDVRLAVRGAPISKDPDWLPAVELFGEGLFLHFDEAVIRAWLARSDVREREEQLQRGYMRWVARYPGRLPDFPGLPYVLLHSLSHALMQEIALDCGYPASSLKERVYALKTPSGSYDRCGILIY